MTKNLPAELSKSEWVLMDALWIRGRGTATDLQGDLKKSQDWAYSTVKTMLDRLVEKGFVTARRVGNVYEYMPKVRRPTAVASLLDDITDRLLDGSVGPFVQRLIERRKLSEAEAAELRKMLDSYDSKDEGK